MSNLIIPIFLLSIFLTCCTIPRVVVLHDPLSAEEHTDLGVTYEKGGQYDLAIEEYNRALEKDRNYTKALFNLGNVYYHKGEYRKAERYYKKALKRDPTNGNLYNNLSWVYISQSKRLNEAELLIKQAIILSPDQRVYYLDTLGTIYYMQGRYLEAKGVFEEAASAAPNHQREILYQIYTNLGLTCKALHLDMEAERAYREAEKYK